MENNIPKPQTENSVHPEIALLRERLIQLNEMVSEVIGLSLDPETIPQIELLEDKSKSNFFGRVVGAIRGYTQAAGADRKKRTITLMVNAQDRDIVHELGHFVHFDMQDERVQDETDNQEYALVQQSWEEGVAVFIEMEFLAHGLLKKNKLPISDSEICQKKLTSFPEMYKKDNELSITNQRFKELVASAVRFDEAEKKSKLASSNEKPQLLQVIKDIKTMATSKDVLYDVGYRFVIDAIELIMKTKGLNRNEAFEIVMSHKPQSITDIINTQSYINGITF